MGVEQQRSQAPLSFAKPAMSDFRKAFWDECYAAAKKSGAKFPELVAAQCCLESGFGRHISGRHNYLGIKGQAPLKALKSFITVNGWKSKLVS